MRVGDRWSILVLRDIERGLTRYDQMRASLGISMTYLENTQIGIGYNWFFGDPGKTINNTTLAANPYADRDYATLNVKYNF